MHFEHDTHVVLVGATALANTWTDGRETLVDTDALLDFLRVHWPWTTVDTCSEADRQGIIQMRNRLVDLWSVTSVADAAEIVNELLEDACALPRLVQHDDWPWHLHYARPKSTLPQRLGAELAMGFAEVVRRGELDRLGRCTAPDCKALTIDLTRNRSRRYCDTGNCANRQHVAAYRSRRRATKHG